MISSKKMINYKIPIKMISSMQKDDINTDIHIISSVKVNRLNYEKCLDKLAIHQKMIEKDDIMITNNI